MNNPGGLAQEREDPWVCPNDRELSLRAKLQSGWSFYTNRQLTGKKVSVKKEEHEIIVNIIKKSEEVALREEYRIGRLVDRLENIKNNAKGNGVTSCLLCNEKFGKITATPMKCNICEKAACSKCGVDTISSGNVPIWLCKLCNEQREFCKKSGAWFLRQMPQHKLPSRRERYLTSGSFVVPTPELSRKSILQSERSDLYSDSDQESTPSASSEELLDDDHRHVLKRRPQVEPPLTTVEPPLTTVEPPDGPDGPPRPRQSSLIRPEEFGSSSRSRTPSPSFSDHGKASRHSLHEDSDDDSQLSRGSRLLRRSPLLVRKNKKHSLDSNPSTISDQVLPVFPSDDDKNIRESFTSSLNNEQTEDLFQTYGPDYKLTGPLGVIEFTLNYLKDVKRLDVHIHNAKGLRAMDNSGTSDPYVKIHLLPGANKSNKTRTHTFHKTLDPLFNETLAYHGITEEDMKNKTLRLQVLDEDRLSRNDFIGQTSVPLKQVLVINNKKMQKILEPKSQTEMEDTTSEESPGRIHISLRYVSKEQKLVVGIIRCANLVSMDTNGYSDPYVKCYLLPDPSKKTKRRTKVKKRNLNPEFNETFSYKIPHNELAKRTLEITVWDHDVGKSNDFIGGVHMGIRSKGSLLKQWFETLKDQNKEFAYWHTLTQDIILHEAE